MISNSNYEDGRSKNLQQGFQLGEHNLPHRRHNAGSPRVDLQSGQRCFINLIKIYIFYKQRFSREKGHSVSISEVEKQTSARHPGKDGEDALI
jgi:hypothetical protein